MSPTNITLNDYIHKFNMAHHAEKLPWEALASVFELRRTNPCQHGAYNLHARIQPDSKTKLANFVQIFMQSVAEDATQQPSSIQRNTTSPTRMK